MVATPRRNPRRWWSWAQSSSRVASGCSRMNWRTNASAIGRSAAGATRHEAVEQFPGRAPPSQQLLEKRAADTNRAATALGAKLVVVSIENFLS